MKLKDFFDLQEEVDSSTKTFSPEEIKRVYEYLNYSFDFGEFSAGMNVELEHIDVTHGDLVMTAKITAAHLLEVPNYYTLLKQCVEK